MRVRRITHNIGFSFASDQVPPLRIAKGEANA